MQKNEQNRKNALHNQQVLAPQQAQSLANAARPTTELPVNQYQSISQSININVVSLDCCS